MWRGLLAFLFAAACVAGLAFWWQGHAPAKQLTEAKTAEGEARVGEGAAEYALDARDIYHASQDRERTIIQETKVIRAEILSANGADTPVPPDVVRAVNGGLRKLSRSSDDGVG